MSRHNDRTRLLHMLDHAQEAVEMARGRQRQDLDSNRQLGLALTRLLEIVGEAASRVSPATRQQYPSIQWIPITGMRNRLIHGYDDVDFDIMWDVIEKDLPPLIVELRAALTECP